MIEAAWPALPDSVFAGWTFFGRATLLPGTYDVHVRDADVHQALLDNGWAVISPQDAPRIYLQMDDERVIRALGQWAQTPALREMDVTECVKLILAAQEGA